MFYGMHSTNIDTLGSVKIENFEFRTGIWICSSRARHSLSAPDSGSNQWGAQFLEISRLSPQRWVYMQFTRVSEHPHFGLLSTHDWLGKLEVARPVCLLQPQPMQAGPTSLPQIPILFYFALKTERKPFNAVTYNRRHSLRTQGSEKAYPKKAGTVREPNKTG